MRKITIKSGDTLVDIINPYFMNEHFRMNYEWYINRYWNLTILPTSLYQSGDTLKIPIYIDSGSRNSR